MKDRIKTVKENKEEIMEMFATMGALTEAQQLMSCVYIRALADNNELRKLKKSKEVN